MLSVSSNTNSSVHISVKVLIVVGISKQLDMMMTRRQLVSLRWGNMLCVLVGDNVT